MYLKIITIKLLFFLSVFKIYASRPSTNSSAVVFTSVKCLSAQINWTNGNGQARIVVVREGASVNFTPTDNTVYTADSKFKNSSPVNSDNYIVYNGSNNFVNIDNLNPQKTYYVSIFEHDNAGANTLYLTNSPGTGSFSTYFLNLQYTIQKIDSCEKHNSFKFTNTSSTNIPGQSYYWNFGDGDTSSKTITYHSYKNKVGKIDVKLLANSALDCPNNLKQTVNVYPKKNVYFDFDSFKDTQCLDSNYFEIVPQPLASPAGLNYSFTYKWFFGDGSSDSLYRKMKKSYTKAGTYHVELETVLNFTFPIGSQPKKSGCKDTLHFDVVVLKSPLENVIINDSIQCLKNNLFLFSNTDPNVIFMKWKFGDNDSSNLKSASHSYQKSGQYKVVFEGKSNTGCSNKDSIILNVLDTIQTHFLGIDTTISNTDTILLDAGIGNTYNWNNGLSNKRFLVVLGSQLTLGKNYFFVKVTKNNDCNFYDTLIINVTQNNSALFTTYSSKGFNVFPIPFCNTLNIQSLNSDIINWNLFDFSGRSILSGSGENLITLDLNLLSSGSYFLKVNQSIIPITKP